MAAQIKTTTINLLPKDPFSESLIGKILLWALSIGRYIVVFTELIVILSFLSRFKLDRNLTDLNSSIQQQVAVIESFGQLESNFRTLQNKLAFIRQNNTQLLPQEIILSLTKIIPADVKITSLSITGDNLDFSATALSSQGFISFVNSLRQNKNLYKLELTNVSSTSLNENVNITFNIRSKITQPLNDAQLNQELSTL